MKKLMYCILIVILISSSISCEKDNKSVNPFIGNWNVYVSEELRFETSFSDNYSWTSNALLEPAAEIQVFSGKYYYDDSTITTVNVDPKTSMDTLCYYYAFIDDNEFDLEYFGPIKIGVPKMKYRRKQN